MNREIKFRGKRIEDGEWLHGDLLHICGGCIIYHGSQTESQLIEDRPNLAVELYMDEVSPVYSDTIGQFTGLYDKNGKEIYEGDILMCIGQREDNKWRKYFRKVLFKNGSFCMNVPEYNVDSYLHHHIVNGELGWEVIGNIYDNKELLEETK